MAVTIRFVGSLRAASKKTKLTLEFGKTASLKQIVKRIVDDQPKLGWILIDSELDDPRTNALILVNGKDISVLGGLDTMLEDGDELVLVPVAHGG